jgi:cytoskeletal protein RodZ
MGMRTVGRTLKEARLEKLLTLEEVEKNTKIRKELLEALENDDYSKLPPSTFVKGFIKNYGKYLGIDTPKLLALFRRDYEAKKHPDVVLNTFSNPLKQSKLILTPTRLLWVIITLVIFCFFAYLWVEYRQYISDPNLIVMNPQDQQTVDIPEITIQGKTDPETKVTLNNQEIGVDENGNFKEEVKLNSSTNQIEIAATNKFNRTTKIDRTVFVRK